MTFSFVREIYPPVYRQFCRMMGVPASAISRRDETFENVLGLVRGRLYYNLFNWYRILALLPGYRFNRGFMEQMMGVSEPLPAEHAERIAGEMRGSRLTDAFRLVRTLTGLVANHITIERRVRSFYRRVNDALAPPVVPLADCRPDELVAALSGVAAAACCRPGTRRSSTTSSPWCSTGCCGASAATGVAMPLARCRATSSPATPE